MWNEFCNTTEIKYSGYRTPFFNGIVALRFLALKAIVARSEILIQNFDWATQTIDLLY